MAVRLSKAAAVAVRTPVVFGSELAAVAAHGPVVRGHRFTLGNSLMLEWSDVIQRADGTVWVRYRRRPGRELLDGGYVGWERLWQAFDVAVIGKRDAETRGGYLTGEEPIQFWYGRAL